MLAVGTCVQGWSCPWTHLAEHRWSSVWFKVWIICLLYLFIEVSFQNALTTTDRDHCTIWVASPGCRVSLRWTDWIRIVIIGHTWFLLKSHVAICMNSFAKVTMGCWNLMLSLLHFVQSGTKTSRLEPENWSMMIQGLWQRNKFILTLEETFAIRYKVYISCAPSSGDGA